MKNYIVIIIVAALAISGLFFFLQERPHQEFLQHSAAASVVNAPSSYAPPATEPAKALTEVYDFGTFTLRYPGDWSVASTSADGTSRVVFVAPKESAADALRESMIVYEIPAAASSSLDSFVAHLQNSADPRDPYAAQSGYVLLDGMDVYQIFNHDGSLRLYPVPVMGYSIAFWHQGVLYDLVAVSEEGVQLQNYLALFAAMGDSIRFVK